MSGTFRYDNYSYFSVKVDCDAVGTYAGSLEDYAESLYGYVTVL